MSNHFRVFFLLSTIVAVLLVSAVGTTSVYADDGTATGSTDTTEVTSAESTSSSGEQPVVTTKSSDAASGANVSDEATPAVEDQSADTTSETSVSDETTSVVEEQSPDGSDAETGVLLEQVPDNTTVTVLDEDGEAQPLTSQASADAILLSDPIWCPEGQSPNPRRKWLYHLLWQFHRPAYLPESK